MPSNEYKKRIQYLTGGRTRYELLSALRRANYAERKNNEDKSKMASGLFGDDGKRIKYFPEEYNQSGVDIKEPQKAGITTLGIMKTDGKGGWEVDTNYDKEIAFGDRLIKPIKNQGVIRALNSAVLKENMQTIIAEESFTNKLVKLLLSDPTGQTCRYVLPDSSYASLVSDNATPDKLVSMSPNSPEFATAITIFKNTVRNASSSIHFEDDIDDLFKSLNIRDDGTAKSSSCCCK